MTLEHIQYVNPGNWQGGVYKITAPTGQYTIGSTNNFRRRWYNHTNALKTNKHCNPHTQHLFNKYNTGWTFETIEQVSNKNQLLDTEQKYLDLHFGTPLCINLCKCATAPFKGRNHSISSRKRISLALSNPRPWTKGKSKPCLWGHLTSPETRLKIGLASANRSPESKLKTSLAIKEVWAKRKAAKTV